MAIVHIPGVGILERTEEEYGVRYVLLEDWSWSKAMRTKIATWIRGLADSIEWRALPT